MSWCFPVALLHPSKCGVCRRFVNCTDRSPGGTAHFSLLPLYGPQINPLPRCHSVGLAQWGEAGGGTCLSLLWGYATFVPRACPLLLIDSDSDGPGRGRALGSLTRVRARPGVLLPDNTDLPNKCSPSKLPPSLQLKMGWETDSPKVIQLVWRAALRTATEAQNQSQLPGAGAGRGLKRRTPASSPPRGCRVLSCLQSL